MAAADAPEAAVDQQQQAMEALTKLGFPELEKAPPHFSHVKLRIGKDIGSAETKLEDIENAPALGTITNMQAILKNPIQSIKKLKDTYLLADDAQKTLGHIQNEILAADNDALASGVIDFIQVNLWKSAALYELIRISIKAESRLDRLTAASALLESLKFIEDERYKHFASYYFTAGMFSQCEGFLECYELVGKVAIAVEALSFQISQPSYLESMQEQFQKTVTNLFLQNLLTFRLRTMINHATLLEDTGMHLASQQGKQPYLNEEQLLDLRTSIDEITGPEGFWQQTQTTLQSQMNEENLTSYEQMLNLLTAHLIAEYKKLKAYRTNPNTPDDILAAVGHGLVDENMIKRANAFRPTMENGQDIEQYWVKTLPERILEALMMAHYNNLAIKMYLLRIEHGAENFLQIIDTNLEDNALFSQNSFDPIAGFVALAFFAKVEFRLPTRADWLKTLNNYSRQMIQYAEPFEKEKQRENPKYDFLDTTFIKSAMTPIYALYESTDYIIRMFVENANLKSFSQGNVSLIDKEKWLAERMLGFHSLYYQWRQVADAEAPSLETINELAASISSVEKEKLAEEYGEQFSHYMQKLFTTACYAYWLPLDKDGNFIENFKEIDVKELVEQKPSWQTTYYPRQDEYGLSLFKEKSFDLKQVCGGTAKQVNLQVHKFLADYLTRHMPRNGWEAALQHGLRQGGDVAITLATVQILSPAFGMVHRGSLKVAEKIFRTSTMRFTVGMMGRVTGLLSQSLGRKFLRRQGLYWTHQVANAAANILLFTVVQRGLEHGLYTINETFDTNVLPGRKFFEYNPRVGIIENLKVNYAQELIFGGGLFLVVPQFAAIAKRQIYTRSPLRFWRYKVNMANIDHYYMTRGLQRFEAGQGIVTGTKGMGMTEEFAYIAVPLAYNTAAFTSIPYVIRAYEKSQGSDAEVWQGWKVFVQDDLAQGFTYAGVFAAFHLGVSNPGYRKAVQYKDTTNVNAYYKALDIKPGTPLTPELLKAAYEKAPKGTNEEILVARQAYQTLSDPVLRQAYDAAQFGREFGFWGWAHDLNLISHRRGL